MNKNILVIVSIIIVFLGIFFIIGLSKNDVLSGDSYYEERCIDITQYLTKGYTSSGTDSNGCPLVQIRTTLSAHIYYTNMCGGSWVVDPCRKLYSGSNIAYYFSSTQGCQWFCDIYNYDTKGGLERVLNTCTFDVGDMLVAESFSGAKVLTKDSLRYPIKSFCRAHPSIITDDALQKSITSTNIPQDLIDGKSVSINTGQTLTVFYVINNRYNLPSICDSSKNLALDTSTNKSCKSTLGFTYLCSEGVFDALTGSCVVEPGVSNVCTQGRYDTSLNKCVYNPPLQINCPTGYTYDISIDSCYRTPESVNVCQTPYVLYEPSQSECTLAGNTYLTCPQCPIDKICDQSICHAQCTKGIECRFTPDNVCIDGQVINGLCVTNSSTISICPDGSSWNTISETCTQKPDVIIKCPDNTTIQNGICYSIPKDYVKCPATQVLNSGKCVDMTTIYDANTSKTNSGTTYFYVGIVVIILGGSALAYSMKKKKRR